MSEKRRDTRRIKKIFLVVFVLAIGLTTGVVAARENSQPAAQEANFTRDMDLDDDGVWNVDDNCPLVFNPVQDMDGDGIGEACNNGYDVDLDGIFDSVETELINTFAPIVSLYSTDPFRPAGVEWLFQRSDTAALLGEYAGPGGTRGYILGPIGDGINLLGVSTGGFSSGPAPVYDSKAFRIDMFDPEDGYGTRYGNLASAPFYASVGRGIGYKTFSISYWFFYPWNDCGFDWAGTEWCYVPFTGERVTHEGDWEHIVVWVKQNADGTYTPGLADYYYHGLYHRYTWDEIDHLENRPAVYSALQTHASYAWAGTHDSCLYEEIGGTCAWQRRDYTDLGVGWDPLAPGGAGILNVGQRQLLYSYNIDNIGVQIDPSMGVPMPGMEWILYEGRWGDKYDGIAAPAFEWYEGQTGYPPTLWKVPDQQVQAGVPHTLDLGVLCDWFSEIYSQDDTVTVDWGDGNIESFSVVPHLCDNPPDSNNLQATHTYAAPGDYYVEVIVVDYWNVWGGNVFKVTVNNAAPTDIALSNDTLPGNMPVGTLVGNFSATDPVFPAEPFVYELVPGEGDVDNGYFTISGDQLLTAGIFDYNVKNSYSIRVQVTDNGGMAYQEAFTIAVTANNYMPMLLTPGDGENLPTDRPTFDWTDVPATSYTLQIARNITFTNLVTTKTLKPSIYIPIADLPANTTLYWRVKINKTGVIGPWSLIRSFHTANPPGVPALVSPANNALVTNYTTRLDWMNSTVPAGVPAFQKYQVQVATDAGFASIVYDQEPTLSEFTPPSPWGNNTKYYWRVRAFNTANEYSGWSLVRSFRSAILPLLLESPDNTTTPVLNTTVPFFEWEAVTGATGYKIQVSAYSNLSSPVINVTVPSYPYIPARALLKNKVYYWRVRAEGPNGPSLWSSVWTFKTGNPPSTPVLVSPANRALLTNYMPTLTWRASIPAAGLAVDNYEVQVGTDANFNDQVYRDYVGNVTTFTFTSALPPNTSYYWRVRALGSNGHYTPWSLTRSFRLSMLAPILISPVSGSSTTAHKPTFEWQAVDGATSYTIQISISSSFGTFLVNKTVTTLIYIPTTNLPHRTIYWRVRANGPNGPSAWTTGNFTILP